MKLLTISQEGDFDVVSELYKGGDNSPPPSEVQDYILGRYPVQTHVKNNISVEAKKSLYEEKEKIVAILARFGYYPFTPNDIYVARDINE